jgi:ElaB/YqjD/DUF883 family membrane-anchored ribosome-binding protein
MSNPDEIRADIEATRSDLSTNVDALADKVTPSKIAARQTDKIKGAFSSARDAVMGTVADVHDSASGTSESIGDAAGRAKSKVEGNPFAVGLIAFGVGLLAASLVPASAKEKELAATAKDAAQPLVDELTDSAKDAVQNLKEPTQEAAAAVKDSATSAAEHVRDEAASNVDDLMDQASQARDTVQNESRVGS